MSKPGRKKTPTAVLKIRGSWRAKTRKSEPKPPRGKPDCPEILSEAAKEKWNQLIPILDDMGLLSKIDGDAIARYCESWARWADAIKWIHEKGEFYPLKDDNGNVKCLQQFPQVGIANHMAEQMNRLAAQFGMTPSARAGLSVDPGTNKKENTKEKYFA